MILVFATNNLHKIEEIRNAVGRKLEIKCLKDIGCFDDLPETHLTIKENAEEKARFVYDKYRCNCFADDTALEIDSLNGEPGVFSARYAGTHCSFDDNINLVLKKMHHVKIRTCKFRTVIALIMNGDVQFFEGIVRGSIAKKRSGVEGFGYDPVFIPDGYKISFAEMSLEEKNKISHRAMAIREMVKYLRKNL